MRRLLERLIVVNAKDTWWGRRVKDEAADPRGKEPVARGSEDGHQCQPVEVRHAHARRNSIDL